MQAAQQTTAPIMIAATGPIVASAPISTTSTPAENRIVAMVIPDTGLFEEPTRPAMYADTDTNRKPATIMMMVIGILTSHWPTIVWYRASNGRVKTTTPIRMNFIGRSRSVCATLALPPERATARPVLIPEKSDLRSEISVHTPPTSIAP